MNSSSSEFLRLPLRFDAQRMLDEVRQFAPHEWRRDRLPTSGYWSLNLISFRGGDGDRQEPPMGVTPALRRCPYLMQVLASFETTFSEVRLRKLETGSSVPPHYDEHYFYFQRMRGHVPVLTDDGVTFHCGGRAVHMPAGEAWIFNRLREHFVTNAGDRERIHLVFDTLGSARFRQLLADGDMTTKEQTTAGREPRWVPYRPEAPPPILDTELMPPPAVLPPAEVKVFVRAFLTSLRTSWISDPSLADRFCDRVAGFERDWEIAWAQFGTTSAGLVHYRAIADALWTAVSTLETEARQGAISVTPLPSARLAAFLRTGAFVPHLFPRDDVGGSARWLGEDLRFRIRPEGTIELWCAQLDNHLAATIDDVDELIRLARGEPTDGGALIKTLAGLEIVLPRHEPPLLADRLPARQGLLAEGSFSEPARHRLEHSGGACRLRMADTVFLQLASNGRLRLCANGEHRLIGPRGAIMLIAMASGLDSGAAAERAGAEDASAGDLLSQFAAARIAKIEHHESSCRHRSP